MRRSIAALLMAALVVAPALAGPTVLDSAVDAVGSARSADPALAAPGAVVLVALAGAALGWLWLVACVVACVVEALRAGSGTSLRPPAMLRPLLIRALVAAVVGSAVSGTAAHAETGPPSTPAPAGLTGLRLPDRVAGAPGRVAGDGSDRVPDASDRTEVRATTHVVAAGETLWGIAAGRLAPRAPAEAVDRAWRALYRANRARVGPDPDLIHPGLRLRVREPASAPAPPSPAPPSPARPGTTGPAQETRP